MHGASTSDACIKPVPIRAMLLGKRKARVLASSHARPFRISYKEACSPTSAWIDNIQEDKEKDDGDDVIVAKKNRPRAHAVAPLPWQAAATPVADDDVAPGMRCNAARKNR